MMNGVSSLLYIMMKAISASRYYLLFVEYSPLLVGWSVIYKQA